MIARIDLQDDDNSFPSEPDNRPCHGFRRHLDE